MTTAINPDLTGTKEPPYTDVPASGRITHGVAISHDNRSALLRGLTRAPGITRRKRIDLEPFGQGFRIHTYLVLSRDRPRSEQLY